MKHQFLNNDAWVLSYREECFDQIGLKPSIKIPLYNGSLECEFRKYQIFDGKLKDFRSEGGIVKTDEEKKQMAEKHRFKKEREFKKRLTETEENEEGDIRSFTFHSRKFEDNEERGGRKFGDKDRKGGKYGDKRGDRDDRRSDRRDSKPRERRYEDRDNRGGHERFDRSGKRFDKGGRGGKRDFGKKNRRFDDDED